jgi:integrase
MAKVSTRNRNKNQYYKDGRKKPANWEYRFPIASINGKRQHASQAGFKTQKEAEAAGTKALAEYLNAGQIHKPSDISVADYLDQWLEQYVYVNLRPNSQSTYKGIVNNHIKPAVGHYRLQSLNPSTLQDFVNDQKKKGFSKQHVDLILSTFKGSLNYAIEPLQLIQSNPMMFVKAPKMEKKPRKRIILRMDDWNRIIERFPFESKHHVPLMIGFHTGLRIGEVFGLTWNDIDLDAGTITVNKQQIRFKPSKQVKNRWCFAPPKSTASYRTVKIGQTLIDVLKKHKLRQKEQKLACGEYYVRYKTKHIKDEIHDLVQASDGNVDLVCTGDDGAWITPETFRYCSKTIQKQLMIQFEFHALRHTHATLLAESGVNPKNLQMRLGHEKIETTLQTYIHDTKAMADETVDMFERIVCGQNLMWTK